MFPLVHAGLMGAQCRETLKAQAQRESLVDVVPNLAGLCLVMLLCCGSTILFYCVKAGCKCSTVDKSLQYISSFILRAGRCLARMNCL